MKLSKIEADYQLDAGSPVSSCPQFRKQPASLLNQKNHVKSSAEVPISEIDLHLLLLETTPLQVNTQAGTYITVPEFNLLGASIASRHGDEIHAVDVKRVDLGDLSEAELIARASVEALKDRTQLSVNAHVD